MEGDESSREDGRVWHTTAKAIALAEALALAFSVFAALACDEN